MIQRLQSLNNDIISRLDEKPSFKLFNKSLNEYDLKLKVFNSFLDQRVQEMNEKVLNLDADVLDLDMYVKKTQAHIETKLDITESKKIWEHFQRFAMYNDLKDLYSKCLPEIAKFE